MSAAALEEYYEEYWQRERASLLADPHAGARLRLLLEEFRVGAVHSAVDVGCGAGKLVAALTSGGIDALGLDISQSAIDLAAAAHPHCRFVRHTLEERPWPVAAESIDAVVAFEVIEHLLQPAALVAGAYDALRRGGRLILTTPFHGRAKNMVLALTRFDRHFAVEGDHIRFFSDASLRALLERSGFAVERIRHFGRAWPLWAGVFVVARKQ
ncbi:MAG: class I SAM-dependent methyltransferase [Gaiellaceae bacterium]